jgi:hypothetical protein
MSLAELQQIFAQALFDSRNEEPLLPVFKGNSEKNARRFGLYRGNLTAAWDKALAAAFPVMRALVGEEFFSALAREYGKAHPSKTGDLNQFGAHFAEFLSHFPHVAAYPYFPDVAALEWEVHKAHYADNAETLTAERFAQIDPNRLDHALLGLHPACALTSSPWAIVDMWLAHQPGSDYALPSELQRTSHSLIVRPQWKAGVLPLSPAAYAALSALRGGHTLGTALDAALDLDENFDFASNLQQWLHHGVLVDLRFSDHDPRTT